MNLTTTRVLTLVMPWRVMLWFVIAVAPSVAGEKPIIGRVENIVITDHALVLAAKIDTGATHSSLHAPDVTLIDKNGESWVTFTVTGRDGRTLPITERVLRMAKIKRKGDQAEERPVIQLTLCLGNVMKEVDVNLVDRKNFDYPLLVGRSFLRDSFIVDVSRKFTITPYCKESIERGAAITSQ
ncbi:MAG TPA: RimK/LysX family protein [Gammaproteobacteria bacterium]